MAISIPPNIHPSSLADGPTRSEATGQGEHSNPGTLNLRKAIFDATWNDGLPRKQQSVLDFTGSTLTASTGVSTAEVTDLKFGAEPIFEVTDLSISGTQSGDATTSFPAVSEETDITFEGESGESGVPDITTFTLDFAGDDITGFLGAELRRNGVRAQGVARTTNSADWNMVSGVGDRVLLESGDYTEEEIVDKIVDLTNGTLNGDGGILGYLDVTNFYDGQSAVKLSSNSFRITQANNETVVWGYIVNPSSEGSISFTNNQAGSGSGVEPTAFSVTLDSAHASAPVTGTFASSSTNSQMAAQVADAINTAITAGTVTGLTVSYTVDSKTVELDSTNVGSRVDITVALTNPNTATASVSVEVQGSDASSGTASTYTITSATGHTPGSVTGTFGDAITSSAALNVIRNHFVNGDIGEYTVGTIVGGAFRITSTVGGAETDLTFEITQGTGGNLTEEVSIVTQGGEAPGSNSGQVVTTPAVAEVTRLTLTGTTSGSDTNSGAKEETDITFTGTSGIQGTVGGNWVDQSSIPSPQPTVPRSSVLISTGSLFVLGTRNFNQDSFNHIYTSTDGSSWTNRFSTGLGENISALASDGSNTIVALQDNPVGILSSTNGGVDWSTRTVPSDSVPASVPGDGIAYGNGNFRTNSGLFSSDGVNWSQGSFPPVSTRTSKEMNFVNDRFTLSQSDKLSYSTDGSSWTTVTLSADIGKFIGVAGAFGNGIYIVGGNRGRIATSTNGTTWTVSSPANVFPSKIIFSGGSFVSGGSPASTGKISTSTDGVTWTTRYSDHFNITGLASVQGRILATYNETSFDKTIRVLTSDSDFQTDFSINLDSTHASAPVTGLFTNASNANSMASQVRAVVTDAITSGNVTGLTVSSRTDNVVELDSTANGDRVDITVVLNTDGNATSEVSIVQGQQGIDGPTNVKTSWRLESPSHSPSVTVGTFSNSVTPGVAIQTVRDAMVNSLIPGYTVGIVENGSTVGRFTATSTTARAEDDIIFTITESGAGGDLVASTNVLTQGSNTFSTGTLTSVSLALYGQTFTNTFTTDSTANSQASQMKLIIDTGINLTTSLSGNVLTVTSTQLQGQADAVVSVTEPGTPSSGTYTSPRAIVTTQGLTSGKIGLSISGGGIVGTIFINDDDEYTKAELLTVLDTAIDANTGVFTYVDGGGDLEFASNVNETFPDVSLLILNSDDGITVNGFTKYIGYT